MTPRAPDATNAAEMAAWREHAALLTRAKELDAYWGWGVHARKPEATAFANLNPHQGVLLPPPCHRLHVDHMPGIFEEPKTGPCCAHCGADLGVRGPLSEPDEGDARAA